MTAKAKLALMIGSRTIDDIVRDLDEKTALVLLEAIAKLSDAAT